MPRWFSIRPGITLKGRKFKGIRGWAGKPFHPPLTDVPIGAYTLAAAFDVLSWWLAPSAGFGADTELTLVGEPFAGFDLPSDLYRAATFCLIAGLVAAVPTMVTGIWDWWKSTPPRTQAWRTANWHGLIMIVSQILGLALVLFRLNIDMQPHTSFALMLFSLGLFGLIAFGATYGGGLVYDYAFNVEQDIDYAWEKRDTDVLPGKEKPVADPTP
ncbi:MAG: DUF2231 domain-containing protein [Actinomycetota bacterium]|nr:DUF2231 domain-containing protein [Actinomycetota bacterium]